MWRLKIGEGRNSKVRDPYLSSKFNFLGRQTWEFDPDAGSAEERAQVEEARLHYYENRFRVKASSDVLWQLQFMREKGFEQRIPKVKEMAEDEEIRDVVREAAVERGVCYLAALQGGDGHWPAQEGGTMFYLPPLVICLYITGHLNVVFPSVEHHKEALRYIYNHQNEDGGWGLHVEGHSTMFCTALCYVAMRIMGQPPDGGRDNACQRARSWILHRGGVTYIPSWGKFWLSLLGLMEWSANNPIPPEFWLLPSFLPLHPAKMWCYSRMVYMPMSYLYGKRYVGPITPLVLQLRQELHTQPYHLIDWTKARHSCAKEDICHGRPWIQDVVWDVLDAIAEPILRRWPFSKVIREKAMETAIKHIHYEEEASQYITLASVDKALCMLACWVEDPNGDHYKKHLSRFPDYIWVAEDGLQIQGVGSQIWDTVFGIQVLLSSNIVSDEIGQVLSKAHDFLKKSQVLTMQGRIHQVTFRACIGTSAKVHGDSLIPTRDGPLLIAPQRA
ncbi:Beta-amyrin synthase [Linum grandiflorum]